MDYKETIKRLADVPGISGDEFAIGRLIADLIKPYVDDVDIDRFGNVVAYRACGIENAPKLAFDAHIDQIGLMVSEITDEGFIKFIPIGMVDQRTLPSRELTILTKNNGPLLGVITTVPPHMLIHMDKTKALPLEDMLIDVGMASGDEVREYVAPGDFILIGGCAFDMPNDIICGRAMDNRACMASIIYALEQLAGKPLSCDLMVTATVKEETGFCGATVTGSRAPADLAVAVDVCHARTEDAKPWDNVFEFHGGPVIGIGSNSIPAIAKRVMQIAKEAGINYQVCAIPDFSATNASAFQVAGGGVATVVISLPLKYMHTSVEMVSMRDFENLGNLLTELALNADTVMSGRYA